MIHKDTLIGHGTNINGPCYISGSDSARVRIGKYCAIAYNLRVRITNHRTEYPNLQYDLQNLLGFKSLTAYKGDVSIGNACWIGDNVMILPGVTIGDGAVIGAGSVVTKDIPDFGVAVGVPAKLIRLRFPEPIISQLVEIKWWDWSIERMRKNQEFFETDLSKLSDATDLRSLISA